MTDAEFAQEKQRLEHLFAFWQPLLVPADWEVTYGWERTPSSVDSTGWQDTMSCAAKWTHLKARIYVNVPACAENLREYREADVIHELLHIATSELRESLPDDLLGHEERVVSTLTKIIQRVFAAGVRSAKANPTQPGLSQQEYDSAKEEMRRIHAEGHLPFSHRYDAVLEEMRQELQRQRVEDQDRRKAECETIQQQDARRKVEDATRERQEELRRLLEQKPAEVNETPRELTAAEFRAAVQAGIDERQQRAAGHLELGAQVLTDDGQRQFIDTLLDGKMR